MAKSEERNLALRLRKQGKSLSEISQIVGACKSTVSLWCRDIELTKTQLKKLEKKRNLAAYKGARFQYQQRLNRIKKASSEGKDRLNKLSKQELLVTGLGLYWGEGSKKTRQVRVSNADPEVIKFMLRWFRELWDIRDDRFTLRIAINQIHNNRLLEIERYWLRETGLKRKNLANSTLIKVKNKKNYSDFPKYYGTARLEVRQPAELYYKIMGLINALKCVK